MLANNIQKTVDAIYPVGALYLSMNATNPEQLFGGSWKQLTADAYLKIVTSGASETAKGQTDHKIPVSSMPSHTHIINNTNINWTFEARRNESAYKEMLVAGTNTYSNNNGTLDNNVGNISCGNAKQTRQIIGFNQDHNHSANNTGGGGHTIRAISVFMSGIAQLKSFLQGGAVC